MNKNLPLVELTVDLEDENTGVYAISFVDNPATEVDWYAFDSKKPHKFDSDDTKQTDYWASYACKYTNL